MQYDFGLSRQYFRSEILGTIYFIEMSEIIPKEVGQQITSTSAMGRIHKSSHSSGKQQQTTVVRIEKKQKDSAKTELLDLVNDPHAPASKEDSNEVAIYQSRPIRNREPSVRKSIAMEISAFPIIKDRKLIFPLPNRTDSQGLDNLEKRYVPIECLSLPMNAGGTTNNATDAQMSSSDQIVVNKNPFEINRGNYTLIQQVHLQKGEICLEAASSKLMSRRDVQVHCANVPTFPKQRSDFDGSTGPPIIHQNSSEDKKNENTAQRYSISAENIVLPCTQFYSFGMKVTMVDWESKVFVVDMLRNEVCDLIRHYTDEHVRRLETYGRQDLSWRTLYTYTKMDIPCCEVPGLTPIVEGLMSKVKSVIGHVFGRPSAASFLEPRSWKEPHLLKYQKLSSAKDHVGVESHYDGSDFTWQLMLSSPDEYCGGGTYFRCLRRTLKIRKGQVIIHPGELYHQGVSITRGTRQLVVCFMDGYKPGIKDFSSEDDDRPEYQLRVSFL